MVLCKQKKFLIAYTPPYTVTEEVPSFVMEIAENIGKIESVKNLEKLLRLRKVNRHHHAQKVD